MSGHCVRLKDGACSIFWLSTRATNVTFWACPLCPKRPLVELELPGVVELDAPGVVELAPGVVSREVLELVLLLVPELVPVPEVLLLPAPSGLKSWNGIGQSLSPFSITANSSRPDCGFAIKSLI